MKKKTFPLLACALLLASCSGGGDSPASSTASSSPSVETSVPVSTYTVTLINAKSGAQISSSKVDEGMNFAKPTDPSYSDHLFAGWYLDAGLKEEASFPLKVTSDLTIYAKFLTYKEYFLEAREKTILSSSSFQYSSSTTVSLSYSPISGYSLNGIQEGVTKYNEDSTVSFLEEHENSGSLFYDGFKTTYKKNQTLFKISENEDHEVTDYSSETVDDSFRYDSSSFAKALFEYEESDITSLTKSGSKYELKTSWNFSKVGSLVLNQINNKYVEMILGQLPETESSFHMYVGLDGNGYLSSYSYEFSVEVKGVTVSVDYALTFENNGGVVSISEPSFPDLSLSDEKVGSVLTTIDNGISSYKAQEYSAYDYKIDSTVEVGDLKSVGVTSQGSTKRKVQNGVVYYHNLLEVDSEHKDSDMYKEEGVEDYTRTRAKLSDGSVYDAYDRTWPLSNEFTLVESPLQSDEFYALIDSSFLTTSYVDAVQKTKESAYDEYSLVINKAMGLKLLSFVNEVTRLDHTLAKHYLALGDYDETSVSLKDASFYIGLSDGLFKSLSLSLKGEMDTSYEGTSISGSSLFDLSIEITTTSDGQGYEIPTSTDEIEL